MTGTIPRREFLKTTTTAAGSVAYAAVVQARTQPGMQRTGEVVRIGSARYVTDGYSTRALPPTKLELRADFWKPKLVTNATVTIPLLAARNDRRGLNGNVLEAAILSLQTHPDPKLQAVAEARVAALTSQPARGNRGFEVAAAWFGATGRRDLLDQAIDAADALYTEFEMKNPPFSGGERDAINCIQLYRVTKNRRHLDLAGATELAPTTLSVAAKSVSNPSEESRTQGHTGEHSRTQRKH